MLFLKLEQKLVLVKKIEEMQDLVKELEEETTVSIDIQIINDTRLEGEIRVSRTVSYVVEDFD